MPRNGRSACSHSRIGLGQTGLVEPLHGRAGRADAGHDHGVAAIERLGVRRRASTVAPTDVSACSMLTRFPAP